MPANASPTQQKTTPKQDAFVQAMLAGNDIACSAKIAACDEKTAHRWLKLPHVQSLYRNAQQSIFDESLSQLMLDTGEARATLKTIMKDETVSANARVHAAQIILDKSIEIHQYKKLEAKHEEILKRLEELGIKP